MKTETEHLLYFSIPGSFVLAFILLFFILVGWTNFINSAYIALFIASVIPIGYTTYQAYVVTGFYDKIWRVWYSVSEPALDIIEQLLEGYLNEINDDDLRNKIRNNITRRYILNYFEHNNLKSDSIDYVWRLINLINSRGVGMFTCLIASIIPILYISIYLLSSYLLFLPKIVLNWPLFLRNMGAYYFFIFIFIIIFNSKLKHIKNILSDYSLGVVILNIQEIDDIILRYLTYYSVNEIKKIYEMQKNESLKSKLLKDTYTLIKRKEWKASYDKAIEIANSMQNKK